LLAALLVHGGREGPRREKGDVKFAAASTSRRRGWGTRRTTGRSLREERKGEKIMKMVGPMFAGGFGGPPRMEDERGNLVGHAKWRSV
jgi:hypothetical protein